MDELDVAERLVVTVVIRDGKVCDLCYPLEVAVLVKDYNIDGATDDELETDENGEQYLETINL